jgi:hypothetical protein
MGGRWKAVTQARAPQLRSVNDGFRERGFRLLSFNAR